MSTEEPGTIKKIFKDMNDNFEDELLEHFETILDRETNKKIHKQDEKNYDNSMRGIK